MPPFLLKLNLSSPKVVDYYTMKETLETRGIFKYDTILSDDEDRSVCIFSLDGKKRVLKLGNRGDRGDTTKFHLLKHEASIYGQLEKIEGYTKYFPKILGSGEIDKEFYYILMEFIEGETLYEYLNKKDFIKKDVLTILLHLTRALEVLWSHNIVHGDLSVENVMIEPGLNVKLIDFEKSSNTLDLKFNTIGTSRLNTEETVNYGYGYFFLVRLSLSVLKENKTLLEKIKKIIQDCDSCKNIYSDCARVISAELTRGGFKKRKTRRLKKY